MPAGAPAYFNGPYVRRALRLVRKLVVFRMVVEIVTRWRRRQLAVHYPQVVFSDTSRGQHRAITPPRAPLRRRRSLEWAFKLTTIPEHRPIAHCPS
ncbi:hypothetical protein KFE25_013555 [Diacronema lutheri]|uniref:Uncharacterized protein n=1 Tax=Diacronema lutheri TaxID=2081491 RepID=A0A8J6CB91_DIALT|nr:hypothetical protein KFE25_013555 [Diacronema lutheri]